MHESSAWLQDLHYPNRSTMSSSGVRRQPILEHLKACLGLEVTLQGHSLCSSTRAFRSSKELRAPEKLFSVKG